MNIVITGASEGIGFETALRFDAGGAHKVFAIARKAESLNMLAEKAINKSIVPLAADLTTFDYDFLKNRLTEDGISHIDVLIHNAGYLINKPFETILLEEWKEVYDVNVIVPAMLTKSIMPWLGGQKQTHIIMIGSMGGITGSLKFPGLSAYSSSKGALSVMAEVMAAEFESKKIAVNCLALGSVQTKMLEKAFPGYVAKTKPADISDFIFEFSINGWKYFNGKTIPVSSGNP